MHIDHYDDDIPLHSLPLFYIDRSCVRPPYIFFFYFVFLFFFLLLVQHYNVAVTAATANPCPGRRPEWIFLPFLLAYTTREERRSEKITNTWEGERERQKKRGPTRNNQYWYVAWVWCKRRKLSVSSPTRLAEQQLQKGKKTSARVETKSGRPICSFMSALVFIRVTNSLIPSK
jgi:hypothetical protein